jgi:hypothetical protein
LIPVYGNFRLWELQSHLRARNNGARKAGRERDREKGVSKEKFQARQTNSLTVTRLDWK